MPENKLIGPSELWATQSLVDELTKLRAAVGMAAHATIDRAISSLRHISVPTSEEKRLWRERAGFVARPTPESVAAAEVSVRVLQNILAENRHLQVLLTAGWRCQMLEHREEYLQMMRRALRVRRYGDREPIQVEEAPRAPSPVSGQPSVLQRITDARRTTMDAAVLTSRRVGQERAHGQGLQWPRDPAARGAGRRAQDPAHTSGARR